MEGNAMSSTDLEQHSSTAVVEKWAEVAGDSVPYLTAGHSGIRTLLVHGAGSSRETWRSVIPALSGDSSVYAPDLVGFGEAPRRDLPHTPEYMADFLLGFMDSLDMERAALVGHSLGGAGLPGGGAQVS